MWKSNIWAESRGNFNNNEYASAMADAVSYRNKLSLLKFTIKITLPETVKTCEEKHTWYASGLIQQAV